MLLIIVTSWLDHREREMLAYLIEENRVLRRQLGGRRLRLTDNDRRKLAARAYRLGVPTSSAVPTNAVRIGTDIKRPSAAAVAEGSEG
jgi:hypothetical protein